MRVICNLIKKTFLSSVFQKTCCVIIVSFIFFLSPILTFSQREPFDYLLFQEHGAVMLLIEPVSGKIVDANRSASEFYGYTLEDLKSMTIHEINAITPTQVESEMQAAQKEDRNYFIFPHRLATGEIKTVEVYSWPVEWEDQNLLFSIIHDISKRTEALEMLLEKERTLSSLFRGAPLIIGISVGRVFQEINQTVEPMLGYTREEMIHRDSRFLYESEQEYEKVRQALYPPHEQSTGLIETRWVKKNSEVIDVLITSSYLDPKEPALGITFTVQDITEEKNAEKNLSRQRIHFLIWLIIILLAQLFIIIALFLSIRTRKRLENSLRESKEKAESANRAKGIFLANMSHELRTPLNGIIGFSEILKETPLNLQQTQYVSSIKQSGKVLLEIINDILDLSKIEAGKMTLVPEKFNLYELIHDCVNIARSVYQASTTQGKDIGSEKSVKIEEQIESAIPVWVVADSLRIKQILLNLLSNAVKFTEKGTIFLAVSVTAKDENQRCLTLRFSVKDTGIGIKKENFKKILEAFNQEDETTTKRYGGTGLGLTITNHLLHQMGSELRIESEEGHGSTFSFEMNVPYIAEDHQDGKTEKSIPEPEIAFQLKTREQTKAVKKILVVEDNEVNRHLLTTRLNLLDPSLIVITARTGSEAVKMANDEKPDLIFMDIQLPDMNGFQVTTTIRQYNKSVPIFGLSAMNSPEERALASKAGMNAFISKPFTESEIKRVLDSINSA